MNRSLVLALSALQASVTPPSTLDVSTFRVGAPVAVVEVDLGALKGEMRQLAWAPNGRRFYLQTAEGDPPAGELRHYWVAIEGGAVMGLDEQPEWARDYWDFKSDRLAPGMESVTIDVEQRFESIKIGTGSAGAADRASDPIGAGNVNSADNLAREAERQRVHVVRLKVYGQIIGEFLNATPIPGLTFGWGPERSGVIAYTDRDGRLILADSRKGRQTIRGVKDAFLPAWTLDGRRLAWVQRSGRRKLMLFYADVTR